MMNIFQSYPYIVVGAGFFGATIAERIASQLNKQVLVIDKRPHIGGNCYSEIEPASGIEVHKYGSHIFHTKNTKTWEYLSQFTALNTYRHKVLVNYKDQIYEMPINLSTINRFFNANMSPGEAKKFIASQIAKEKITDPSNFEEKMISLIGRELYTAFIQGYSEKQWGVDLKTLPIATAARLPFRYSYDRDYFADPIQGLPIEGYTAVFNKMLSRPNIKVELETDWLDIRDKIGASTIVIYTGPIDRFFDYKYGKLAWRTIDLVQEIKETDDYQGTSVINYTEATVPFTRIHEFKHYHPERSIQTGKTVLCKEYSRKADENEDPYYPIDRDEDRKIFLNYKTKTAACKNIFFGGRLGDYKYYDMDNTISAALTLFNQKITKTV